MNDNAISGVQGKGGKKRKKKRVGAHQSMLPSGLLDQLKELDAESDDEDYVLDDMFVTNDKDDIAAKQVEKEMEEALKRMQNVANGKDIVKSAIGDSDQKAQDAMAELQGTLDAATADVTETGKVLFIFFIFVWFRVDESSILFFPVLFLENFDQEAFAMDLDALDTQGLITHCDDTWVKIEENRVEQSNLKKSQQTVVSHLVETNEWLFNALSEILNAPDEQ